MDIAGRAAVLLCPRSPPILFSRTRVDAFERVLCSCCFSVAEFQISFYSHHVDAANDLVVSALLAFARFAIRFAIRRFCTVPALNYYLQGVTHANCAPSQSFSHFVIIKWGNISYQTDYLRQQWHPASRILAPQTLREEQRRNKG